MEMRTVEETGLEFGESDGSYNLTLWNPRAFGLQKMISSNKKV